MATSRSPASSSSLIRADALSGVTVLITGASSGIGRAAALTCASHSARALILFARSMEKLNAVADEIASQQSDDSNKKRTRVVVKTVDVRSSSAVYGGVRNALADLARSDSAEPHPNAQVDVLINNAGLALGAPARFPELKLEDIDAMVATNLSGMLYTTHAVLNVSPMSSSDDTSMLARKSGIIVNTTSTTALEVPPFPGEAVYHTTKAS